MGCDRRLLVRAIRLLNDRMTSVLTTADKMLPNSSYYDGSIFSKSLNDMLILNGIDFRDSLALQATIVRHTAYDLDYSAGHTTASIREDAGRHEHRLLYQ